MYSFHSTKGIFITKVPSVLTYQCPSLKLVLWRRLYTFKGCIQIVIFINIRFPMLVLLCYTGAGWLCVSVDTCYTMVLVLYIIMALLCDLSWFNG